jgi:hypothetical protein
MVFLLLSVQFGMNHNGNWRTDEFFRGLGGSTTKHFTIFTMFSSHGGMTIPIR